jgi:hypothetical protein
MEVSHEENPQNVPTRAPAECQHSGGIAAFEKQI